MYTINIPLPIGIGFSWWFLLLRLVYGHWQNYVNQDSYIFDTSASYNNPSPLSSPLTATVPFAKAQADNIYQLALSYQKLDYIIINFQINIFINCINNVYSSFGVNVYSTNTSNIHLLGFRYLIINSNFSKFYVSYSTIVPNVNLVNGGSYTTSLSGLVSVTGTRSYYLAFTGFDIISTSHQTNIWFNGLGSTATSVSLRLATVYNITLSSASFLLLRYNTSISVLPMKVQVTQYSGTFTLTTIDSHLSYNTKNTLFGIWGEIVTNDNFFNFNFTARNGSSIFSTTNIQGNGQTIVAMVIQTYSNSCCPFPTVYYYPISQTCFDICPPRLYTSSTYQCLPCPHDCLLCNNNGNGSCISCSANDFRTFSVTTGRCVPNLGYYNQGSLSQSQPCASDCYRCSSPTACSLCFAGTFSVIGGCSNVIGCSAILRINNTTTCISCSEQFLTTTDNLCICPEGMWLVTGHCTNVSGCMSTIRTNELTRCIFCKTNFIFSSNTCMCAHGFTLQNSLNECIEICGDGIVFADPCDDGNLVNGDGCSSTCQIQPNYSCFYGSQTHASLCFYHKGYQIAVNFIDKTERQNQGIFVFNITPLLSQVICENLIQSLEFVCSQNITIPEWNISASILTVKVNYTQNLQGNEANLSVKLNQTFPMKHSLNISFLMKSRGMKLLVYEHYNELTIIDKILFYILSFPLFLFVIGSISHKMIGVQVLNTFQVILFTSTLSTHYTQPYILMNYLSSSMCNIQYLFNHQSNFYSKQSSVGQFFAFSESNLYFSQYIIGGIILLCTLAPIVRLIYQCTSKQDGSKFGLNKIQTITQVGYNYFLFPVAIGFLFVNVFAYSSFSQSNLQYSTIKILIVILQVFLMITSTFIFVYEWAFSLTIQLKEGQVKVKLVQSSIERNPINCFQGCSQNYIPAYLSYLYVTFNFFWMANIFDFSYSLYPMTCLSLIFFIWFIYQMPYDDAIHNVGQILNLLLILIFSVWVILRELLSVFMVEQNQMYAIGLISVLIVVTFVVNIVRVIVQI